MHSQPLNTIEVLVEAHCTICGAWKLKGGYIMPIPIQRSLFRRLIDKLMPCLHDWQPVKAKGAL